MEQNHKFISLQGEVFWRGAPQIIPDKHYKSGYFTLLCRHYEKQADGTNKVFEDYFSIHTFSENEIVKIREGFIIQCLVRRDSNIWIKDGEIQTRDKIKKNREGQDTNYGRYQMVFENYNLIGKINIVDDSVNREAMKNHNANFEAFLNDNDKDIQ